MFAAAVAQCVVLDPAAYLVDAVVRQADHVERIGDLVGLRQRHLEAAPIRPERSKVPRRCCHAMPGVAPTAGDTTPL